MACEPDSTLFGGGWTSPFLGANAALSVVVKTSLTAAWTRVAVYAPNGVFCARVLLTNQFRHIESSSTMGGAKDELLRGPRGSPF